MASSQRISLSGRWRFALDPENIGEAAGWMVENYDDATWREVTIPHTWNVMPDQAHYEGVAWYRRSFFCPSEGKHTQVRLCFAAVFYLARIWLNGQYLGEHEGGYTPFEFAISNRVRPGDENVIAVRVDNLRATDRLPAHLYEGRSFGWKNYGGIVRDVGLVLANRTFISAQRVIAVPHLTGVDQADTASVSVSVTVRNASPRTFKGNLTAKIFDDATGGCVPISAPVSPIRLAPRQQATVTLETLLSKPNLWHFDHPDLYRWSARLEDAGGKEIHTDEVNFGIRQIELKGGCFILNGEPVRLAGLSRHASVPGHGLAETEEVMKKDFDDLKNLNMVSARPVHYPQHEYIYDYCDRKGILLSPELPAWQLTAGQMADERMRTLARQQLAEMVATAANHPCVWAWSVGNELESDTVAGRAYVRDMIAYVKSLDATRPVAFASYHLLVGRPWGDATAHADFVMMNQYFGTWHGPREGLEPALDTVHLAWPEKTVFISEFGFAPHWEKIEGPAILDPLQYYFIHEELSADSPEADEQRQCVIRDQMALFRKKPFVAGAVFWEYRGGMGVVDEHNIRRDSWWVLRQEFAPLRIASVDFAFPTGNSCRVGVRLRTRGPVELDLPAYTLRNYRLHWEFIPPEGKHACAQGDIDLPVLIPGSDWTVKVESAIPPKDSIFKLTIIRPTGFTVLDATYVLPDISRSDLAGVGGSRFRSSRCNFV